MKNKETKKRYLFVCIKIQDGEHEYYSQGAYLLPKHCKAEHFAEGKAREYFANLCDTEKDGKSGLTTYFFDGFTVATCLHNYKLISKTEFDVLTRFL